MDLPRRHHYIPRFLLKRFGSGKAKRVWVFDKSTSKSFLTATTNAAVKKDLYTVKQDNRLFSIEPSLAELESKWAAVLKKILRSDSLRGLTYLDRIQLGILFAQLRLRSPNSNEMGAEIVDAARREIRELGGDPDQIEQTRRLSADQEKLISIELIRNLPGKLAPFLVMKRWALHSTVPRRPLFLSDNPVVMNNDRPAPEGVSNLGFAVAGIEVFLPISSTRCLAAYCPSHFGGPAEIPNEPVDPLLEKELLEDESKLNTLIQETNPPLNEGKPWPLPKGGMSRSLLKFRSGDSG